jgi:PAS domain-containing protein
LNIIFEESWQFYAMAVIAGLAAVMFMHRRRQRSVDVSGGNIALLSMVLNNMTQGVILFDAHERVLVCNDRYVEMYGLSANVVKPGCTLLDLINNRITTGSLALTPKNIAPKF